METCEDSHGSPLVGLGTHAVVAEAYEECVGELASLASRALDAGGLFPTHQEEGLGPPYTVRGVAQALGT